MSDSSIALKPVIDEPSKPIPSSSAPSISWGVMAKDLRCPSRSVNQKSTCSIFSSRIRFSTARREATLDVARSLLLTCAELRLRVLVAAAAGVVRGRAIAIYLLKSRSVNEKASDAETRRPRQRRLECRGDRIRVVRGLAPQARACQEPIVRASSARTRA